MFRQLNLKSSVMAVLIAVASMWTLIVAMTIKVTYRNQSALHVAETAISQLTGRQDVMEQKYDLRLDALERYVYGTMNTEPPKAIPSQVIVTPKWDRNKDEDFRRRLNALEQFRLRQESRQEQP